MPDCFRIYTCCNQHGSRRVAEIVKTENRNSSVNDLLEQEELTAGELVAVPAQNRFGPIPETE